MIDILQFLVSRIQHIINDLDGGSQRGTHRTLYNRSVWFGQDISLTATINRCWVDSMWVCLLEVLGVLLVAFR